MFAMPCFVPHILSLTTPVNVWSAAIAPAAQDVTMTASVQILTFISRFSWKSMAPYL
jgi:hypothetical protein